MALWGGRFEGGPSAEMQAFSESLDTDLLMWREDIAGSMAQNQTNGRLICRRFARWEFLYER